MLKITYFKENLEKLKRKGKAALFAGILGGSVLLVGCSSSEKATNSNTQYDVLDTTDKNALRDGITQIIDVPGQDFKLVVTYKCELAEDERWTITSTKKINMEICTDGLIDGMEVYIDNVHTDTTICSHFPTVEGITQDSMDDRIHNALMLGFPIADDNFYYGINQIEGQNDTFISGSMYGFNGYESGSFEEKRFVESDYLEHAVYANKVSSIIDLIIIDNNKDKTSCVSVDSDIQVSVWPFIQMQRDNGTVYYVHYEYDENTGNVVEREISAEEFLVMTEINTSKRLGLSD